MDTKNLPITGPCPIDLDTIGFDRSGTASHCSHCSKNVHILSNMSRSEATAFVAANRGKTLCLSYKRDRAGKILFRADPPPPSQSTLVPLSRVRASAQQTRPIRKAAALAAGAGLAIALAACTPHDGVAEPAPVVTEVEHQPVQRTPEIPVVDWFRSEPDPIPLAGAVAIPEDIEPFAEGQVRIPVEPVEDVRGAATIEQDDGSVDQPCEKPRQPVPVTHHDESGGPA